jgi:chitin-binding protein
MSVSRHLARLAVLAGGGRVRGRRPLVSAHGAPAAISRAAVCASAGAAAGSAACVAARAVAGRAVAGRSVASGGGNGDWDNVRVADVAGRDRTVIPDGRLCSGNLAAFRGLDLARSDWPATTLTAGATLTFSYRATIPHRGTFRIYLTRQGYRPTTPLRWADLDPKPLLTQQDPPLRNGSYQLTGTLPADRTGRHLIFTIWQTSNTPDTYYSCSDVVFGAASRSASPVPSPSQEPSASAAADGGAGGAADGGAGRGADQAATQAPPSTVPVASSTRVRSIGAVGGGTLIAAGAALAVVAVRRRGSRSRRRPVTW